jgi:glyoxylase-like metal-dependent hydrolase (beta-lactamase superfamily II)
VELVVLKRGDLMGSPDCKELLRRAGAGTPAAHVVWDEIFAIKTALGLTGRSTSVLLLEPSVPEAFPAVVDLSYVAAAGGRDDPVEAALARLHERGLEPGDVRSALFTHLHPDHFDPRLLDRLPRATAYGPGLAAFDPARFGGLVEALDTPGHGGPHASYVVDLPALDAAACCAGDLVMSHAHFLSLDHPLSFSDPAAGLESVERVRAALRGSGRRRHVLVPGHGEPFFLV